MTLFTAILIDIENSKKYNVAYRNVVQEYIHFGIKKLNEIYANQLEYEVKFCGGDALQGLFRDPISAVLYFRLLEIMVYPVTIRAGIGIGEWNIKLADGDSMAQDGPAYHAARKAINEVHDIAKQNIRICGKIEDPFLNYLLNVSYTFKRNLKPEYSKLLIFYEVVYPFVPKDYEFREELMLRLIEYKYESDQMHVEHNIDGIDFFRSLHSVPVVINGNMEEINKFPTMKGGADIAELMKCTRQNVEKKKERGNIVQIRQMDYVSLQYLDKIWGALKWKY